MGLTRARLKLSNPREVGCKGMQVEALVDVLGEETLLGATPMEDMGLLVHPATRKLAAKPSSPNRPSASAKGTRTK